jgi:UDP-glucose 4-epimerase
MSAPGGRILITGGLGYVGGRVAGHLQESRGHRRIRLLTRKPPAAWPAWVATCEVVQGDLLDPESLGRAMDGVDTVIHLAALTEVESGRDPHRAMRVNAGGTLRVLDAAAASGARRVVYLSTFHVYGPQAPSPITEATVPRPVHPYAISHRAAEDFVLAARHQDRLDALVLRLSNGYGCPRDSGVNRWTLVFNDLCRQAVQTRRLVLRSSGRQYRDFISLRDVGRAVDHCLSLSAEAWGDGVFNLGGACSLSIRELAERVASACARQYGRRPPIEAGSSLPGESDEPVRFSIDRLRATAFQPEHNWDEEICQTLKLCEGLTG